MTYKELRKRLRAEGFINAEISLIHHQYLAVRAIGVSDDDIMFDREHGLVVNERAKATLEAAAGRQVVIDAPGDRAIILGHQG